MEDTSIKDSIIRAEKAVKKLNKTIDYVKNYITEDRESKELDHCICNIKKAKDTLDEILQTEIFVSDDMDAIRYFTNVRTSLIESAAGVLNSCYAKKIEIFESKTNPQQGEE